MLNRKHRYIMIIALFVLIFSEKQLSRYSVRKLSRAIARNPPNESPRFPCLPLSRPFMHHAGWGTLPCLALPCLALPCLALPCLALPCLPMPGGRWFTLQDDVCASSQAA